MVLVALLAVGLICMHHLVVVACHHAAMPGAHGAPGSQHSLLSSETQLAQAAHGAERGTPAPATGHTPSDDPSGAVGAAAMCLAILLMIVAWVLPQVLARERRPSLKSRGQSRVPATMRVPIPPDLILLSVSRT